jgi:signal transduction histidine kinase
VRNLRRALWPAGLALGVAAEWVAYEGELALTVADGLVGFALIGCGLVAWERRPASGAGPIMAAAGFAWFLGTFGSPWLYLHRGPLAHLILSFPGGRLRSRVERASVGAAYVYAAVEPIAGNEYATIGFASGLVAVSAWRYAIAAGPERQARGDAVAAGTALGGVLLIGAVTQIADADVDRAVLWAYFAVVFGMAVGLTVDLLSGRWAQSAVTGLVVDLGDPGSAGPLRGRLARALGDPTLAVGYYLAGTGGYVDETGRPFELPDAEDARAVTPIEENGAPVAALVHNQAALGDPELVDAVAAAARLAVSNARLQADVRARVAEVEGSRRRIVQSADAQRRRLERELREGAELRLARVAELLDECGPTMADVGRDLDAARSELREFARGIHPRILTDGGLSAALEELAARSPVQVTVDAPADRWQAAVEAAAYFICSEALTNVAKYAGASGAALRIEPDGAILRIAVVDDGVGGADPSRGSGLRGLVDRAEALGGGLRVDSLPGRGTRLVAEIPLR